MQKKDIVKQILATCVSSGANVAIGEYAWAPSNLALCKYWGKRDEELNLPVTSSLSVSLGNKGTLTRVGYVAEGNSDVYVVNGKEIGAKTEFAKRLHNYLDLFRPNKQTFYRVETDSTVPIAAGMASSASGYAALVLALNKFYNWNLNKKELSILARLGSGSACRSLWNGFVEWHKGELSDGMDSYAELLPDLWPELRIGALVIAPHAKEISSREAMRQTVETSIFYKEWPRQVERDLSLLQQALADKDFYLLGNTAEHNSLAMHALMQSAAPPIIYTHPETLAAMQRVWELRRAGIEIFFTQDAGANLQLLFLAADEDIVVSAFPEIKIIAPFADLKSEKVILVDENDQEIGCGEKLPVHIKGQLHRAFSVMIVRRCGGVKGEIEVLLQQRSRNKYHSAGLWSNTCCGHPRPGENILAAAQRRLQEEMGIDVPLQEIGTFCYRAQLAANLYEHEIDHVFIGELSCGAIIKPNAVEVQNHHWIRIDELVAELQLQPQRYTAWLRQVLQLVR